MNYFDVTFIGPSGHTGKHIAFLAESPEEAKKMSPVWLSSNSPFKPSDFKVIHVEESLHKPILDNHTKV